MFDFITEMSHANRPHIPHTEVDFYCVFRAVSQAPGVNPPEACAMCNV